MSHCNRNPKAAPTATIRLDCQDHQFLKVDKLDNFKLKKIVSSPFQEFVVCANFQVGPQKLISQDLTWDEPVVSAGDPGDPVNKPDVYTFTNGNEVHMCAGEFITREELRILTPIQSKVLNHQLSF